MKCTFGIKLLNSLKEKSEKNYNVEINENNLVCFLYGKLGKYKIAKMKGLITINESIFFTHSEIVKFFDIPIYDNDVFYFLESDLFIKSNYSFQNDQLAIINDILNNKQCFVLNEDILSQYDIYTIMLDLNKYVLLTEHDTLPYSLVLKNSQEALHDLKG